MRAPKRAGKPRGKKAKPPPGPVVYVPELEGLVGDVTHTLSGSPWAWRDLGIAGDTEKPAILAFDVGRASAYASIFPARLPGFSLGSVAGADYSEIFAVIHRFGSNARAHMLQPLIIVEDVFVHEKSPNYSSALALARMVGGIVAIATTRRLPVVRVLAHVWQSKAFPGIRKDRAGLKAASIERARAHFGEGVRDEHEADACNLALWAFGATV